jgi:DNA-directed RNA polymerase specialized sigma24 family protein
MSINATMPTAGRAAVLLHYMEGKPRGDVARELDAPEGTLARREPLRLRQSAPRSRRLRKERYI